MKIAVSEMMIVCNLRIDILILAQGKQMLDRSKNISQVLDFALPFVYYYYYYVMHLLWFSFRHDMKHCSFFCDKCFSRIKNRLCKRFNGFILFKIFKVSFDFFFFFLIINFF